MNNEIQFLIGSYTQGNKTAAGEGITLARFGLDSGGVTVESVFRDIVNPSYLTVDGDRVYAVSEVKDAAGEVLCFERANGELKLCWRACSRGRATCHLTLDRLQGVVHAASYLDALLISLDAETGRELFRHTYKGGGPCRDRQSCAHAHQARVTPDGAFLLVPDLGSDKLWRHRLDMTGVPKSDPDFIALPPGTGPRHLVFHPSLPHAYVLGELDGRIHRLDWRELHTAGPPVSIASPDRAAPHGAGAIRRHPRLPRMYASHRGSAQIAFLEMNPDGALSLRERFDAGGKEPRDFRLSPDGRWLIAACQHSDCVSVHRVNENGNLSLAGTRAVPSACCLSEFTTFP